jgi:hypothetical protein
VLKRDNGDMVDIRCRDFNGTLWAYVAVNARRRRVSRCKALENIVEEHMRILADRERAPLEEGEESAEETGLDR